ncbi:MAG: hypothetical protein U0L85_11620 [Bacilli bacterium]|nr:hypothetical protein [Bacilli bacterium]
MDKRELKRKCYIEALKDAVIHVDMVLNQLKKIEDKKGIFDEDILYKDQLQSVLDLELSLVNVGIILRKMSENLFITIPQDIRRDINSLIHSNRFDYDFDIYVYSQKGKEKLELDILLDFCKDVLSFDKVLI